MTDINIAVYNFLLNSDKNGLEVIKSIFISVLKKSYFKKLKDYNDLADDLFHQFYLEKLLPKKDDLLKRFENDLEGLMRYIYKMMSNFLTDINNKKEIEEVKIFITKDEEDDESQNILENIPSESRSSKVDIEIIESKEILEIIKTFLSEEDKKVLCHIVFKDKQNINYCLENLSQDAIYKRVERLKTKLKSFVETYCISQDGFKYFIDEFLMSEICKKVCL